MFFLSFFFFRRSLIHLFCLANRTKYLSGKHEIYLNTVLLLGTNNKFLIYLLLDGSLLNQCYSSSMFSIKVEHQFSEVVFFICLAAGTRIVLLKFGFYSKVQTFVNHLSDSIFDFFHHPRS